MGHNSTRLYLDELLINRLIFATLAAGKTDGKMKRLSQVKTPEWLEKTKAAAPKKQKYLRSTTSALKKGENIYDIWGLYLYSLVSSIGSLFYFQKFP